MAEEQKPQKWWQTLPGVLTAIAGLLTATTGLIAILHQTGFFDASGTPTQAPATNSPIEKGPSPQPTAATITESLVHSQSLSWGPDQGKEAGACLDECSNFVPWSEFRSELERLVLPLTPNLPSHASTNLGSLSGQNARVIQVTDQAGNVVGNVWVGVNPAADWRFDGLLRVGSANNPPKVWASFERLSNGSYRRH